MPRIMTADIGTRLCEALGLDPEKVTRIGLDFPCGDVATATVSLVPDAYEVDGVVETIKRFELHPIEGDD